MFLIQRDLVLVIEMVNGNGKCYVWRSRSENGGVVILVSKDSVTCCLLKDFIAYTHRYHLPHHRLYVGFFHNLINKSPCRPKIKTSHAVFTYKDNHTSVRSAPPRITIAITRSHRILLYMVCMNILRRRTCKPQRIRLPHIATYEP